MSDARAATDDLAESLMLLKREFRGRDYATCQAMLHVDREVGRMAARIRELEARQVPDGWQVVPKEPTVAMERSAAGRDTRDEGIASMYSGIYRAMLAAAPRP